MAITLKALEDMRIDNLDSMADDFGAAGKQFGQGEETFGSVAARIASGDIWTGGGQEEADTTLQINLSALTIGTTEMQAAKSTVTAFAKAMSTAQKTVRAVEAEGKEHEIFFGPHGDASSEPKVAGRARKLEGKMKGAIVFAGLADASCKGLFDRITSHVFTFSPSADKGALEQNGGLLADALYDRDLAATNLEFWDAAKPQALPPEPGPGEKFAEGVGDFFTYLWEHPETAGELLYDSGVAAAGIVLTLLGAGAEVGSIAVSATGVGSVVGVPAGIASAGIVVGGLALAGAGAHEAVKDLQKVNSQGSSGGTSGSTGPKPPQKADDVLKHIDEHNGAPPSGYKGGKTFENSPRPGEQKLPEKTADGDQIKYTEYDVDPKVKGVPRNAERLVLGDDGSVYYTSDHYTSYIKVR